MASSDHLLDKRIVDRNLQKGLLSKKDIEKHLAGLKDTADNAEYVDPEAEPEPEVAEGEAGEGAAGEGAADEGSEPSEG